jgi:hypothetical protein
MLTTWVGMAAMLWLPVVLGMDLEAEVFLK